MEDNQPTPPQSFKAELIQMIPLLFLAGIAIYGLKYHSWERVLAAGSTIGAYLSLVKFFPDFKPVSTKAQILHFLVLSFIGYLALNIRNKGISPDACKASADGIYREVEVEMTEFLKYPGAIVLPEKGITLGNFDEKREVTISRNFLSGLLEKAGSEYCNRDHIDSPICQEIMRCIESEYAGQIEEKSNKFVTEAKRCLELSYELNLYLAAPKAETFQNLKSKFGINEQTKVLDITEPSFPTMPESEGFSEWFSDPELYGLHTVFIMKCPVNGNKIQQIQFIKIK